MGEIIDFPQNPIRREAMQMAQEALAGESKEALAELPPGVLVSVFEELIRRYEVPNGSRPA